MSPRVLVVDDDNQKLSRIIKILEDGGIERDSIDVAQNGMDARKRLTETSYEFLVLDIALPMRPEDSPDRRGGIKLLEELVERSSFKLPRSVVGMSAYEDLQRDYGGLFRSRLWTLDLYDPTDTGWAERLRAKTRYIVARASQKEEIRFNTDVCVIAALQTPELKSLRSIEWGWKGPYSLDEVGFYYEGCCTARDRQCSVVAAAAPRMGMVATAILTTKMITKFRPRLIAMIGICAGVRGKCGIGDVLVADPAWDWQMGKYTHETLSIAPDHIDIPTAVSECFKQLASDDQLWFDIHRNFAGKKPETLPKLKVGPVTSGSAVLADSRVLAEIREQHRDLLGVEMELYGMYAAARDCSPPTPIVIGVKSVCDYADDKKSDDYQAYSSYVSAHAFATFCGRYAADLLPG